MISRDWEVKKDIDWVENAFGELEAAIASWNPVRRLRAIVSTARLTLRSRS